MFPCLVVDRSHEGFRLRGGFRLKRGQLIELIVEDDPLDFGAVRSHLDRQSKVTAGRGKRGCKLLPNDCRSLSPWQQEYSQCLAIAHRSVRGNWLLTPERPGVGTCVTGVRLQKSNGTGVFH